jgi:hypothetical protein
MSPYLDVSLVLPPLKAFSQVKTRKITLKYVPDLKQYAQAERA